MERLRFAYDAGKDEKNGNRFGGGGNVACRYAFSGDYLSDRIHRGDE